MHKGNNHHRARWTALIGALLALAVLPGAVLADTQPITIWPATNRGLSIAVADTARLDGRIVATVSVSFTCEPFDTGDPATPGTVGYLEYGSVQVVQASGRAIAQGQAEFYGGDVTCDGTTRNVRAVSVVSQTVPFHGGSAIVGAQAYVVDTSYSQSRFGATGPVSVRFV